MAEIVKLDLEHAKAYRAFSDYCLLGEQRSLKILADRYEEEAAKAGKKDKSRQPPPTRSYRTLRNWSSKYRWAERVAAYDRALSAERAEDARERLRERDKLWETRWEDWREDAFNTAQELLQKGRAVLQIPLTREIVTVDQQGRQVTIQPTKRWTLGNVAQIFKTAAELMEVAAEKPQTLNMKMTGTEDDGSIGVRVTEVGRDLNDDDFNRTITALVESLGAFLPATLIHQPEGDLGAGEQPAVGDDLEPSV